MRRRMGRPGLMGTMARTAVVAGTATAVSGGMRKHSAQNAAAEQQAAAQQQQAMVDQAADQAAAQVQAQQAQAQQAPPVQDQPAPTAMSTDDKIAKIKELGELKTAGLLSEEEFATEKGKILAG